MERWRAAPRLLGAIPQATIPPVAFAWTVLGGLAPALAIAGAAMLVLLVAPRGGAARARWLAPLGVILAAAVYREAAVGVALLHVLIYVAVGRMCRVPDDDTRWRAARAALVLFTVLAVVGRAQGLSAWTLPVRGLTWAPLYLDMMLFMRLASLLWEVGAGRVRGVGLRDFIAWSLLPFTLFGPLLRFSDWQAQQSAAGLTAGGERRRLARLALLGALQLGAVVALEAARASIDAPDSRLSHAGQRLAQLFVLNPWSFYLLAAGYINLVIAAGGAAGIRVPRGFDRPFGRPNLSAFWASWNIPVTTFVRDALFYQRWGLGRADAYVGSLFVFVLIGLWHSGHAYWLLWGLLHGLGFALYLAYARRLRAGDRAARAVRALVPGRLATYIFVCGCWAAPPQILRLIQRL